MLPTLYTPTVNVKKNTMYDIAFLSFFIYALLLNFISPHLEHFK